MITLKNHSGIFMGWSHWKNPHFNCNIVWREAVDCKSEWERGILFQVQGKYKLHSIISQSYSYDRQMWIS